MISGKILRSYFSPFAAVFFVTGLFFGCSGVSHADYRILVNHLSTDLSKIPLSEIESTKSNLHIVYEHTSHGSQLISGMDALENYASFGTDYEWSDDGSSGLDLDDVYDGDLSQGDYIDSNGVTPWVTDTRNLLDNPANNHINVIMWSWCSIAGHDIPRYLENMEILISEYGEGGSKPRAATSPVTFVFMTGHAENNGEDDASDSRNKLIRAHCFNNERVLFDFADMENYDPNGLYYLDKRVTDDLDYDDEFPYDSGGQNGNWAIEYIEADYSQELTALTDLCSSCAHSDDNWRKKLNCVLKGRAAWWLFARINGWSGEVSPPVAGDVNSDGTVDLIDTILTIKIVAGIDMQDSIYSEADVNEDGKIGLAEVLYSMQTQAGSAP